MIEIPKARGEWISGASYIVYCMGVTIIKTMFRASNSRYWSSVETISTVMSGPSSGIF